MRLLPLLVILTFVEGALAQIVPKAGTFFDFEGDGYQNWALTGSAFGLGPSVEIPQEGMGIVRGYSGDAFASSAHGGSSTTGELTSPSFTINQSYLSFLIGGGSKGVGAEILVEGESVFRASGQDDLLLRSETWNLKPYLGKTAIFRVFDGSESGSVLIDHIQFGHYHTPYFPPTTRGGLFHEPGLVPTPVVPGMVIPEGFAATVFADHETQGVTSPTALTVAEDGRIFLAETHRFRTGVRDNRDHLYWILDDIASTSVADRLQMHRKWQAELPMSELTGESEVVRMLQDTTGDGVADSFGIFADGFNSPLDGTAAGILAYDGTVYFACIPALYALQDHDGDGQAETRTTIQDGFGTRVSYSGHDANGFALGPDGRLYGTIGDRSLNLTTREGVQYKLLNQGAAFRFEPDGSNFEIIHTGLRNPKEVAFNEFGDLFSVDNNADMGDKARIIAIVDGGDTGWRADHQTLFNFYEQIGLTERPPNRWTMDRMSEPQNEDQPAWMLPPLDNLSNGPSGLVFQPGTAMGGVESGRFFLCDYKGGPSASGVWSFGLERAGASYQVVAPKKFLWGAGVTDIDFGYDGKAYLSDFIQGWRSAPQGNILALESIEPHPLAREVAELVREGFDQRSPEELAELLSHPDQRIRLRAQLALERKPRAIAHFYGQLHLRNELLDLPAENLLLPALDVGDEFRVDNTSVARLHALWGLSNLARRDQDPFARAALVGLLQSADSELRAQAAKGLGESQLPDATPLIAALADPSSRVASFAALSLARLRAPQAFAPLLALAIRAGDEDDLYLRHAAVVGLSGCATRAELQSLSSHALPPARLAALLALRLLGDAGVSRFLLDIRPEIRREAIRIIHDTPIESARPALVPIVDDFLATAAGEFEPFVWRRLIHSLFRLATPENAKRLFQIAKTESIPLPERREALRLLKQWTSPHPVDQSLGLYAPLTPRPLSDIRPLIQSELGPLITSNSPLVMEAIALVTEYETAPDNLDESEIVSLIGNQSISPKDRTAVLNLLLAKEDIPFLPQLLKDIVTNAEDPAELRLVALRALVERKPALGFPYMIQSLQAPERLLRQGAAALLADHPHPEIDLLLLAYLDNLSEGSETDTSIALEMLASARKSVNPAVMDALTAYREGTTDDPLADYLATLDGGDIARGSKLFSDHPTAQCARCHLADSRLADHNMAGPHLAGIGQRSPRYLLESLIHPSAEIARSYAPITITLTSGESLAGTLLERTPEHIDLLHEGEAIRLISNDIADTTDPISPMPSMVGLLAKEDIRDLVAYLGSLATPTPDKKPLAPEPKRYHPSPATEHTAMADENTPTPATPDPADNTAASSGIPEGVDQAFWDLGKTQYATCSACHQPEGEGLTGAFPPLAESEWVTGPIENLIRIQLRGLQGPIEVNGQTYNSVMAGLSYQSDEQIAAVLTYVRNSFGNSGSAVKPAEVAEWRTKEEGQTTMLTVADLIDPKSVVEEVVPGAPITLLPAVTGAIPDGASRTTFPAPFFTLVFVVVILLASVKFAMGRKG